MNYFKISAAGKLTLGIGGVAKGVVAALSDAFRGLFAPVDVEHRDDRQPLDTDLIGELNLLTGRLDVGNDPYGWYGND